MERLLLLWDELDEIMGYGRHLAAGMAFSLNHQRKTLVSALSARSSRKAELGLEEPAI
jgi:hypothetical protein